jgi:hypothetical protein
MTVDHSTKASEQRREPPHGEQAAAANDRMTKKIGAGAAIAAALAFYRSGKSG